MFLIYKYTNIHNNKIYIGQTKTTMEQRAQSNGRNYRGSPRFYEAIKKYGWNAFTPEILASTKNLNDANFLEIYYISKYDSTNPKKGYNISLGGYSPLSDIARQKISEKAVERYKDKTKNPMYGRRHSKESIQKMSVAHTGTNNPMYGTKWTENQRMNSGVKGKKLNLSSERRNELKSHFKHIGETVGLKPVKCLEDSIVFQSVTLAAKKYGVKKSTLCGHLNGHQHTCAGKHFVYVK